ncbi:amino acid deaminase [Enterovibrio sp. ZSDZ35]|uniref:Amino acid deaminase n=1 Tax=Enterovibrio qingdaonensis TaxID=2899818 RepID=A0ABT5QJ73_9GAMM|nr:amino acid deaminase [Enterovibrio sp. ZSDZ35]MDD1781032.1 amino acid deaminase [Enterovibrio sp. ZSDZ35]
MSEGKQHADNHDSVLVDGDWPIGTKGVWITPKDTGRYHLIHDEISLPAAVILENALNNNADWMQRFATVHSVELCPHGKTTMTPALFQKQLEEGAWGITVATPPQADVAAKAGAENIIMANQLVGRANMSAVSHLLNRTSVSFYCSVDNHVNVKQLSDFFAPLGQKINVLIELGVDGGRCGIRNLSDAQALASYIRGLPGVALAGVEVYEGVIHGENDEQQVSAFIRQSAEFCRLLKDMDVIESQHPVLTGAGSAWYDVVSDIFQQYDDLLAIIRPGCYLTHDTGIYQTAQEKVMQRAQNGKKVATNLGGDLQNALEVWAYVVSLPEAGKAVVGLGKRDAAYDAGLPVVERGFRAGKPFDIAGLEATAIMDQHLFINVPDNITLEVGDILAFSTSHPCLTFDKWRYIALADDEFVVEKWMPTQF